MIAATAVEPVEPAARVVDPLTPSKIQAGHLDRLAVVYVRQSSVQQQRMHQGRLNKARRGELFNHPPIGYVRLSGAGGGSELEIDPDQQAQGVVRLIFEKFDELGTINAVLRYLVKHQILLPIRAVARAERGQLQWRGGQPPTPREPFRASGYARAGPRGPPPHA